MVTTLLEYFNFTSTCLLLLSVINIRLSDEGELYIAEYQRAVGELDILRYIAILSLITLLQKRGDTTARLRNLH